MSYEKNSLISLLVYLLLKTCISIDTITPNRPLKDGDILISSGERFALGFFSPQNSTGRYVGIWYNKVSDQTVVWVANRDNPITDTTGVLSVDKTGNLEIFRGEKLQVPVWSTNVSTPSVAKNYSAQLLESGNFVVFGDSNKVVVSWQSFDFLSDTCLPYMKIGVDRKSGLNWFLTSWKSPEDPGTGAYSFRIDVNGSVPQSFLYKGSDRIWRGGPFDGIRYSGVPEMGKLMFIQSYVDNPDELSLMYTIRNASIISRLVLNESGIVERLTWHEGSRKWVGFWSVPKDRCDIYGHCGAYGNCNPYNVGVFECKCLPGFEPKSENDWYLWDGSDGCVRKRGGHVCGNGEGFVKVPGVKLPDTRTARVNMSLGIKACMEICLRNCNCTAYTSADVRGGGNGCMSWYGELVDLREFSAGGEDIFIRVDAIELAQYSKKSKRFHGYLKVIIVVLSIAAVLLLLSFLFWLVKKKKKRELFAGTGERTLQELLFSTNRHSRTSGDGSSKMEEMNDRGTGADVHLYSLSTIVAATDNFSLSNKLGEGGFGSVYKGMLHNEQEIAVKRLSNNSGQGIREFKNEVTLIAKLQHRNLVKLLGYCIQKEEKMLIYEYLPNKGLDCFIFDKEKKFMLDWRKRFDIILGIARGIVYLHHDSRLRIIHRDLKASNVLLDDSLNPKISDFGMARIFGGDQLEETTKRVVGTYGYMSPEYAMEGLFSVKSDVFSFGVLLLEIISGRKNNSYYQENSVNLIGHVWDLWKQEKALEIVDSSMGESNHHDHEIMIRCIHIGLLCVQESATARPTMSEVAYMLSNETTLPPPSQPAFIFRTSNIGPTKSSSTSVGAVSANDVTISMVEAR